MLTPDTGDYAIIPLPTAKRVGLTSVDSCLLFGTSILTAEGCWQGAAVLGNLQILTN